MNPHTQVTVTRTAPGRVRLTETFSPGANGSVQWSLSVLGLNASVFTSPISSAVLFDPSVSEAGLSWWSPWDRNSYTLSDPWTDPLSPSDGHLGFWPGSYIYGRVYAGGPDMIVAPLVAVIHPSTDTGFSVQMDPSDPGTAWAENELEGINNSAAAGFAWHRSNLRLDGKAAAATTFTMNIVTHAGCWRPALGWHVNAYPTHWGAVATQDKVALVDGLGSYGSDPIPQLGQNDSALHMPVIKRMHYKVNWDLSGRFYHYMGM